MPHPEHPELPDRAESMSMGPDSEADVRDHTTHEVDADDMFDPQGI